MTDTDLGWCTGFEPNPDEQAARRWAIRTLRGLTEYE